MATVRRVQLLPEMGILGLLLCLAFVLQCVASDDIDHNGNNFKPALSRRGKDENLQGNGADGGRQPPPPYGGGGNNMGAGSRLQAQGSINYRKRDPGFHADDVNRGGGFGANNQQNYGKRSDDQLGHRQPLAQGNLGAPKSYGVRGQGLGLGRKLPQIKIAEHPACSEDARQLCSSSSLSNNFAVLDCLQSDFKKDVTEKCQHFLWEYKKNLTTDLRFDAAASEVCKDAMEELSECKALEQGTGHRISCLIEHKSNISNASCKQFLTKMASIVFSDYLLIYKFADACQKDIAETRCGRIAKDADNNAPHSQGHTIACLSSHLGSLETQCKREIVRIAELQADDYHMDRPLFYACREDRERFCQRTKAGGGKVYKCLYRHKFEREMSTACREKLVVRQSLTRESIKVNKAFSDACRHDIRAQKCLSKSGDKAEFRQAKLSIVLLCLEGAQRDGNIVTPECIGELKEVRRSLMEDYKISPDIVVSCSSEIKANCNGGLHREGKTLHCLMDLARANKKHKDMQISDPIGDQCRRSLEKLLREADAGEDYSLDPALQKACQPVVDTACKNVAAGEARVMSCLMEKVGTTYMNDECEEKLMEIQYFIARDFKLDARLYKFCHKDAEQYCHADPNWSHARGPSNDPIIFSCLYRQQKFYSKDPSKQLTRACTFEVKRVMRQRSISVELEPRIEEPCLANLGQFCSEKTEKGQEIQCLREKFKKLDKHCQWAVANFTEDVDKDPTIDRILMRACTPMIKSFCSDMVDKDDAEPSEIMGCLIKHKHSAEMNRKCAVGIEHHQLVTMAEIKFSFKFKEACKTDVVQYCKTARKKADVISCLSEIHRNDTLLDKGERLSRACRKQLRFELFQRSENIELDPALLTACGEDRRRLCQNITPGNAMVIECLKKHRSDLSAICKAKLFKRERYEALDNSVDFVLMTSCKSMIKQYCPDTQVTEVYPCLLKHKSEMDFDPKCRRVVKERLLTHHKDYRLNPELSRACRLDIPKFCKNVLPTGEEEAHMVEGRVLNCLKIKFVARRLSRDCEDHVRGFIKEAALNYKDDPVLATQCKEEIQQFCIDRPGSDDDDDKGHVEECLRRKLTAGYIKNEKCKKEIARILSESRADIQVDPLLHRACALDIKHYCFDVPQGEGRQMSCLLTALEDKTVRLQTECRNMLRERVVMWEYAAKVAPPENFGDIFNQVQASKSRNYFLGIILLILCVIFFGGLFCGRVTKRVRAEVKNK